MSTHKSFGEQTVSQQLNLDVFKRNWTEAINDPGFVLRMALTAAFCIMMVYISPEYFVTIQYRTGAILKDPILDWLPIINVSQYIFSILYLCVFIIVFHVISHPRLFMMGLQAYMLMTATRYLTVYFIPLDPHPDMILLTDPVLNAVFYGGHEITKDLFFSGHTATIFLFAMLATNRYLKIFFFILTAILAMLIMVQHIHYSYDVLAAPFFAWLSYFIVKKVADTTPKKDGGAEISGR